MDARVDLRATTGWLAGCRLARPFVDAVLRSQARRHLAHLDRLSAERAQAHILLDLVRQAGATRFGQDHDFRRIRGVKDFQRLVPIHRPIESARLDGHTEEPEIAQALASRRAAWTALALVSEVRPRARVFQDALLCVDDPVGGAERSAWQAISPLLRANVLVPPPGAGGQSLLRLARQAACVPVTCVRGDVGRLLQVFDHVCTLAGRDCVLDVWPNLTAVLHDRLRTDADRALLAEAVGSRLGADPVLYLETWSGSEGSIAVQDPRHGLPRLLVDHGVYFEFVPVADGRSAEPRRYGVREVETGVPYEVVLTAPGGWWACRSGLIVRFERRDPPLVLAVAPVLAVDQVRAAPHAARTDERRSGFPVQPPHPQSSGTPAVLPGMPVHIPWSTPADRG
jgi:hypothetical protein